MNSFINIIKNNLLLILKIVWNNPENYYKNIVFYDYKESVNDIKISYCPIKGFEQGIIPTPRRLTIPKNKIYNILLKNKIINEKDIFLINL